MCSGSEIFWDVGLLSGKDVSDMFAGLEARDLGLREVTVILENGSSSTQYVIDLEGMPCGQAMSCRKLRVYTKVAAVHDKVWVPQSGMLTKEQPARVFSWRRQQQHDALPVKSRRELKTFSECKAEADKLDSDMDVDKEAHGPDAEASAEGQGQLVPFDAEDEDGFGGRPKVHTREVVEDPAASLAQDEGRGKNKKAKAAAAKKKKLKNAVDEDEELPQVDDLGNEGILDEGDVDPEMKSVSEKHSELTGKQTTSFMALQVPAFLRGEGSSNHITGEGAPVV